MKTLFVSIFHGHIARNILLTDILKYLKESDLRVVVLCPEFKKDYYQTRFGGENIFYEGVSFPEPSTLDRFFRKLYYFFVDTETVRLIQGENYLVHKKYLRYAFNRILTMLLGHSRFLRNIIRYLDKKLVQPQGLGYLFEKYNPDLVFVSSITSDQDSMLLREVSSRKVSTIGMIRSWDNLSVNKGNIRIYPGKLLVHNKYMKSDAISLADFQPKDVEIVGMPHFDYYTNDKRLSVEEISHQIGTDPQKKIILFLMIGLSSGNLDHYIASALEKLIASEPALHNFQLVVRPHPNTEKKVQFSNSTVVNYPTLVEFQSARLTDREFTKEDLDMYASLIAHSEVVVSYQGTSIVDACALNKPIINIAFDEKLGTPYLKSMRHQYEYTHLEPVLSTGGVKVVYSESELKEAVLNYISNPELDRAGRERVVEEQCFKLDGLSSFRVVEEISKAMHLI